jgi:hypothetical protein
MRQAGPAYRVNRSSILITRRVDNVNVGFLM